MAARHKNAKVKLIGGPRHGESYPYPSPLPKELVFQLPDGQEAYFRKPGTTTYVYADEVEDHAFRQSIGLKD